VLDVVGILVIVEVLDVEGTPGVVGFDVVDTIGVEDFRFSEYSRSHTSR